MIKFIQCIRRKPELSAADFRKAWEGYIPVWEELARLSEARRMATSLGLEIEQNTAIRLARGTGAPFDGVVEVWWPDGAHVKAYAEHPGLQEKLSVMRGLQEHFVDFANSNFFFVAEKVHLGQA